jgi:hypothetical protein
MIRTLRVRGEAKLNCTLRFSANSNHSAHGSQTRRAALSRPALQFHFFESARVFFLVWKSGRERAGFFLREEASGMQKKERKKIVPRSLLFDFCVP